MREEHFSTGLLPKKGLRWLDVGCGNGAFTQMVVDRCSPTSVEGIDPSEGQLAYARTRGISNVAQFRVGDAMALPFADDAFDVAVMPLVIFFVPDPAKGVAEMTRVVGPGGTVAAYAWDMLGGGFPYDALWMEMRAIGAVVPMPPSPEASRMDAMLELWTRFGMSGIETREIIVQRTFANIDEYWATVLGGPSTTKGLATMSEENLAILKTRMLQRLRRMPPDESPARPERMR